ncbi:hypothetical protein GCM10010344_56830 [Streptomyces bluensis]|nr:hypothetical protein GCM10010344_56830 [Streptomyces bluensis]
MPTLRRRLPGLARRRPPRAGRTAPSAPPRRAVRSWAHRTALAQDCRGNVHDDTRVVLKQTDGKERTFVRQNDGPLGAQSPTTPPGFS